MPTAQPTLTRNWRIFAAILLPIGPACVAAVRFVLPYFNEEGRGAIDAIAAAPERQNAVVWLGTAALFTLVPAVTWVGRVTRRGAPRLTAAAMLLLVPGYLSLSALVMTDGAAWYGVDQGIDRDILADQFSHGHPSVYLFLGTFVVGHVIGTVLLGIAMWRSGAVPKWVAIITIICQPMHFTAAVIVGLPPLDLFSWGLNTVAFAMVSLTILRMSDAEWDPQTRDPQTKILEPASRA
jgi:hypothetical protein